MKGQLLRHKNTVPLYDVGVMGFSLAFSKKPVKRLTDTGPVGTLLHMKGYSHAAVATSLRYKDIASPYDSEHVAHHSVNCLIVHKNKPKGTLSGCGFFIVCEGYQPRSLCGGVS